MPTPTTRAAISKPLGAEFHTRVNWNAVLDQIDAAFALTVHDHSGVGETPVKKIRAGVFSGLPAPSAAGMLYFGIDTGTLSVDTGSSWVNIGLVVSPFTLTSTATAQIPLTLVGAVSQTGLLLQFKNAAGNVIGGVTAAGRIDSRVDGSTGGFVAGAAQDVQLYRSASAEWTTPNALVVGTTLHVGGRIVSNTDYIESHVTGNLGGFRGGAGQDVLWYRDNADEWRTPDAVTVDGVLKGALLVQSKEDGVTGGFMAGETLDVQLYRSGVDTWRTPDSLVVGGQAILEQRIYWGNTGLNSDLSGDAPPEGVVSATPGSTYRERDGGRLWIKRTGVTAIGWKRADMSIVSVQRAATPIASGVSLLDVPITAVGSIAEARYLGAYQTGGSIDHTNMLISVRLLNTTTVRIQRGGSGSDMAVSWEVTDYGS